MQRLLTFAALLTAAAGRQMAPSPAPALGGLGASWLPSSSGRTCAQTCASRGSALSFVSAAEGTTSLCAFTQNGQLATGSESSAQPGVCQAGAATSTDFSCKCLGRSQLPGLALPLPADPTCDRSCAQAMSGVTGTGVRLVAGSERRVCIAHEDIGSSNRFTATSAGAADAPVTCQAGAATLAGANFSCVCEFTLAPAVAVEGDPRVAAQSLATLG